MSSQRERMLAGNISVGQDFYANTGCVFRPPRVLEAVS
jgi:hypothetical protein